MGPFRAEWAAPAAARCPAPDARRLRRSHLDRRGSRRGRTDSPPGSRRRRAGGDLRRCRARGLWRKHPGGRRGFGRGWRNHGGRQPGQRGHGSGLWPAGLLVAAAVLLPHGKVLRPHRRAWGLPGSCRRRPARSSLRSRFALRRGRVLQERQRLHVHGEGKVHSAITSNVRRFPPQCHLCLQRHRVGHVRCLPCGDPRAPVPLRRCLWRGSPGERAPVLRQQRRLVPVRTAVLRHYGPLLRPRVAGAVHLPSRGHVPALRDRCRLPELQRDLSGTRVRDAGRLPPRAVLVHRRTGAGLRLRWRHVSERVLVHAGPCRGQLLWNMFGQWHWPVADPAGPGALHPRLRPLSPR